jgi:hypothetical protein
MGSRTTRTRLGSDDSQEQEDDDDGEDQGYAAAAVIAEAGTQVITAKAEDKNEDDEKKKKHSGLRSTRRFAHGRFRASWLDADLGSGGRWVARWAVV